MGTNTDVKAGTVIIPDMSYLVIERKGGFNKVISGTELLALLDNPKYSFDDLFIDALDH
jgi:hypothetical protein